MGRLRDGDVIAGSAGIALLAVMFLDWYSGATAWQAFSVLDLLLGWLIALALALAVSNIAGRGPAVPVALGVITTTLALAATLLVLYRILNQPGPNDVIEVRAGAWLGLGAVAAVFGGAWWSMSDEQPRPADPPAPEPERRPAPPRS